VVENHGKKNEGEQASQAAAPLPTDSAGSSIQSGGYLNLVADFLHNFTDGLAIASAVLQGHEVSTTLAVFIHEIPHEIGDYALLVQSGMSWQKALGLQFLTAFGAILGMYPLANHPTMYPLANHPTMYPLFNPTV
jgi:zinc transporter 7